MVPNDLAPLSHAVLKTWSALARGLLLVGLVFWLLLGASWGALHGWIVPRIGELRPQLEAQASRALGLTVRIDAVRAESVGAIPSFELLGVRLLDAQGRVALSLPRVVLALSVRSLWRGGFEQLSIDQPDLDVRRSADGRLFVAGLDVSGTVGEDAGALDWIFSQPEWVIHQGRVRWTDERRGGQALALAPVTLALRNRGRHHDLRLDATPPPDWGQGFSVRARFMHPRFTLREGRWQDWDGQIYAEFGRADVSALSRHADLGLDMVQGRGALRLWAQVDRASLQSATADVALSALDLRLAPELAALQLRAVQGRLDWQARPGGFELASPDLRFETPQGPVWRESALRFSATAEPGQAARYRLEAARLDLGALAHLADRLPLQEAWRDRLAALAPQGALHGLSLSWQGPATAAQRYALRGRLQQVAFAPLQALPGLSGLDAEFDLTEAGGQARLNLSDGQVIAPRVFAEPVVRVDQLSGELRWTLQGDVWSFQADRLQFSNADAQGQASIGWRSSDPAVSPSGGRFPGVLDLKASLARADGARVYRYLPLVIDAEVRDYVRDAVQAATVGRADFLIQGDIYDMPATRPGQGVFRISVDVEDARMAYVPARLQEPGELPWPVLTGVRGQLVFDGASMRASGVQAGLASAGALQVRRAEVLIEDLAQAVVRVDAQIDGPLQEALHLVNTSALAGLTGHALAQASASGPAAHRFSLSLPVADLSALSLQGSVTLAGNTLSLGPDLPPLGGARGVLQYSHTGFSLAGVQVQWLGGEARLDGGLVLDSVQAAQMLARGQPNLIRIQGVASATGLQQAAELGWLQRLARYASGSAAYQASVGWQNQGVIWSVQSGLQGLASRLPAPLDKAADTTVDMRYHSQRPAPARERQVFAWGAQVQAVFERELTASAARLRGGRIRLAPARADAPPHPATAPDPADPLPALPDGQALQGVQVQGALAELDADAWLAVAGALWGDGSGAGAGADAQGAYVPDRIAVQVGRLLWLGRSLNQFGLQARREGSLWRADLQSLEAQGQLEYRLAQAASVAGHGGRIYARLARLSLAPGEPRDLDALLDSQPLSLPALDIVVDDFELRGKRLGRLELEAVNRELPAPSGLAPGREWRLSRFNISNPHASLTASGNWARQRAQAGEVARQGPLAPRRTVLNFKLTVSDGGRLLERLGMHQVVRQASGQIEGQVAWTGPPLRPDYPSLGGSFSLRFGAGQFLKADPGLAKLLGVLSLQALPRRLTLDFRDVFSEGFAFDELRGDVSVDQGMAHTSNLQMKGVNAVVLMEGQADLARETQDLRVVVVPELNTGAASLLATVINPAVGLGSFLAQWILSRPLSQSVTQQFHITGPWTDPQVARLPIPSANPLPQESSP